MKRFKSSSTILIALHSGALLWTTPGYHSPNSQALLSLTKRPDSLTPDWNRLECINTITGRLQNGTWIPPEYFASIPTSASTSYNYNLTIIGCYALCGQPKCEPCNGDAGARLLTWLLPILLMVVGVPFPDVGWERFATIFIPLGNPLGFLWGMLVEIET